MSEKITVKQAAEQLGKTEQFIRMGLQRGILPFGYAFVGSGKRWNYYINEADLKKYIEGGKDFKIYNPRLTVEHAAWLMGKSVKFVQQGLQQKVLPIGAAVELDHYVWDYYISPKLFSDYTGIALNQNE
ncbi:helix-turn-helix domain-containing protein [Lawsonibacter sp. JLR.KK007]|uniref:helix-turn-helix domain-containing protein n=1 Tax=Lawsonibacter sp. JLR.KK007 TaxID=3114293 RepID=UPI002FF17B04